MELQHFDSDGVDIAFLDTGDGEPVILVHGFASNLVANWVDPGWVDVLGRAGRRIIALDNRGHGQSGKLYDEDSYGAELMAEDVRRLMDHLGIEGADVMGYSMGARIAAFLAINHPARVRKVVFGGLGIGMINGVGDPEPIARALEAESADAVEDPRGRAFRMFAEQTGSDLRALAACMRGGRTRITAQAVGTISVPVLVAVGETDDVGGSPAELARLMPQAEALEIPRRNHMQAVGDKVFKRAVLDFLGVPG
jgi:pimeloyl-ACP methyl ester carboxylesterase